jgi:hypothetical protein
MQMIVTGDRELSEMRARLFAMRSELTAFQHVVAGLLWPFLLPYYVYRRFAIH